MVVRTCVVRMSGITKNTLKWQIRFRTSEGRFVMTTRSIFLKFHVVSRDHSYFHFHVRFLKIHVDFRVIHVDFWKQPNCSKIDLRRLVGIGISSGYDISHCWHGFLASRDIHVDFRVIHVDFWKQPNCSKIGVRRLVGIRILFGYYIPQCWHGFLWSHDIHVDITWSEKSMSAMWNITARRNSDSNKPSETDFESVWVFSEIQMDHAKIHVDITWS